MPMTRSSKPLTPREDRRQAWRFVGAGFVLVAIGMMGLVAGLRFSDANKSDRIESNRARIEQLEHELDSHGIPVPAPTTSTTTTTSTTAPRQTTTTRRHTTTTTSTAAPGTTTTTAPRSTTTTTTRPCAINAGGVCIPAARRSIPQGPESPAVAFGHGRTRNV